MHHQRRIWYSLFLVRQSWIQDTKGNIAQQAGRQSSLCFLSFFLFYSVYGCERHEKATTTTYLDTYPTQRSACGIIHTAKERNGIRRRRLRRCFTKVLKASSSFFLSAASIKHTPVSLSFFLLCFIRCTVGRSWLTCTVQNAYSITLCGATRVRFFQVSVAKLEEYEDYYYRGQWTKWRRREGGSFLVSWLS